MRIAAVLMLLSAPLVSSALRCDVPQILCGKQYLRAIVTTCGSALVKRNIDLDYPHIYYPEYNPEYTPDEYNVELKTISSGKRRVKRVLMTPAERIKVTKKCCKFGCTVRDLEGFCNFDD